MRLENKIAVITGAGSGMGEAGALLFAREGARVVVADIRGDAAAETANMVKQAGGEAIAVAADASTIDGNEQIVQAAVDGFGGIDVYWANAGVAAALNPIAKQSVDFFDVLMKVNAKGPWLAARAAMPVMQERPVASFIITASLSGFQARANNSAYSTSKGAAIQLMRVLAIEFAPKVRVNALSPVTTETPMLHEFMAEVEDVDAVVAAQRAGVPLGRLAWADDVAKAALYFASDDSSFITGVNLPIDGGISARA